MISDSKNTVDETIFTIIEYSPTQEELDKINNNYDMWWIDNKLVLRKNVNMESDEVRSQKLKKLEELKNKINTSPNGLKELKNAILELLEIVLV